MHHSREMASNEKPGRAVLNEHSASFRSVEGRNSESNLICSDATLACCAGVG